jgi:hypothetical protein
MDTTHTDFADEIVTVMPQSPAVVIHNAPCVGISWSSCNFVAGRSSLDTVTRELSPDRTEHGISHLNQQVPLPAWSSLYGYNFLPPENHEANQLVDYPFITSNSDNNWHIPSSIDEYDGSNQIFSIDESVTALNDICTGFHTGNIPQMITQTILGWEPISGEDRNNHTSLFQEGLNFTSSLNEDKHLEPTHFEYDQPARQLIHGHFDEEEVALLEHTVCANQAVPRRESKRRKRDNPASAQISSSLLKGYLEIEKQRCQSFHKLFPETEWSLVLANHSSSFQETLTNLTALKTLYFAIGSSESLVGLQALVKNQRLLTIRRDMIGSPNQSIGERMKLIEAIDSKIAFLNFKRRYHIYHVFNDSRAGSSCSSDGFFNTSPDIFASQTVPRKGNPKHLEGYRISKLMLQSMYPELLPDSETYSKKLHFIKTIRKLGERFSLLIDKFGYGILGLIPVPGDELEPTTSTLKVADTT